jgi:hypothetical protein
MDRGKWARALVSIVIAVMITVGVSSLPAGAATTPNLTGSWINVDAPTGGAWALQASPDLVDLTVSWHGSAAQGHPTLAGSADLTLNSIGSGYSGRYDIEESGSHPGEMTITIESADRITIDLAPDAGGGGTLTFDRAGATGDTPPIDWCSPPTIDPNCETDHTPLAGGADVVEPSPEFTSGQNAATVQVSQTGDTPSNTTAVVAEPGGGLHVSSCVATAQRKTEDQPLFIGKLELGDSPESLINLNAYSFVYYLLACVDDVHKAQAAAAQPARVSCPGQYAIKIKHASHSSITWSPVRRRVSAPVAVSCTHNASGLMIHVKTTSRGASLRKVFGRRLLVGVYHSAKASKFATVTAAFSNR